MIMNSQQKELILLGCHWKGLKGFVGGHKTQLCTGLVDRIVSKCKCQEYKKN